MQLWTSKNYHKNDKIYRGFFNYYRNDNVYAEESFDIYRDKKEQTFHYISECTVRVSTGEILNIHVEYIVNKDYIPTYIMIEKIMGREYSKETFEYNTRKNQLTYKFKSSKEKEEHTKEITTAPKYHIATPTAATSMLFLRSKKFDPNAKNSFNVLISKNQWEFEEDPTFKSVILDRASLTAEKIVIEGQSVQTTQYRLFDEGTDFKNQKDPPHIKIFLSPHGAVPYVIRGEDGTKIQIKFLNDLSEKE